VRLSSSEEATHINAVVHPNIYALLLYIRWVSTFDDHHSFLNTSFFAIMVSAFTSSFLAFVTAAAVSSVSAEPIPRATAPVGLLTDEVKAGIAAVLKQNGMPGYSMTIVGLGGPDNVEHAFWGNRTEAGDKVDELVSLHGVCLLLPY
jgi:hypothetical protein